MNTIYQMPDYSSSVQAQQPKPAQSIPQGHTHTHTHHSHTHHTHHVHHAHHFPMGKSRGKKQLPRPKRATSAYVYFSQHYREMLKKEGRPVPRIAEFGKECANKWNNMNEKEKEPFLAMANSDKARYAQEIALIKPQRDANKPKRPGTAFMLFMVDFRKEMAGREPAGGVAAMAKLGGERWRQMSDADKKPYVERQNVEKTKYDINMEEYKNKLANEKPVSQQPMNVSSTSSSDNIGSIGSNANGAMNNNAVVVNTSTLQQSSNNNNNQMPVYNNNSSYTMLSSNSGGPVHPCSYSS